MNEQEGRATMYAVVALATQGLSDLELAILNNVAQMDGDPRGKLGAEKYLHLFDTVKDGKPHMHELTKDALASVVLQRLS
jgi:hypothetical protein